MDSITRAWHEMALRLAFVESRGAAFQTLFFRIMGVCHPDDFIPVRPWGKEGDRKNDGYLKSERRLFQVYAPAEMERTKTEAKMREDFAGALVHWEAHFDKWTFVHNDPEGVPPFVLSTMMELEQAHAQIRFGQWSLPEIRERLFKRPEPDIASVLGPALTQGAMRQVRFDDLKHVLRHLSVAKPPTAADLRVVPPDKLAANALSDDVAGFLEMGMKKAPLVEAFFRDYHDPQYGDGVAAAFTQEYRRLRDLDLAPDAIFHALDAFAGGPTASSPTERAAVLAVLAHLFESCDIFERPQGKSVGVPIVAPSPAPTEVRV